MISFHDNMNKDSSNCNRVGKLIQAFTTEGSGMKFSHTEKPLRSWCVRIQHTPLRVLPGCRRCNKTVALFLNDISESDCEKSITAIFFFIWRNTAIFRDCRTVISQFCKGISENPTCGLYPKVKTT